jgi:hypothetical protein
MECFTALILMALNSENAEIRPRVTNPADLPSLRFQSFSLFFTHLYIHRSLLYQANPMSRNISADIKGQIVDS